MKLYIASFLTLSLLASCFKKEISGSESTATVLDSTSVLKSPIQTASDSVIAPESVVAVNSDTIPTTPSKMEYSTAKMVNTSEGWRRFLEDNPDYENKKEIEENIIRAEVNEISANKDTGVMPEAEKLSGGNQAVSTIVVENDTSCDLTLRYSGSDAAKVVVPPNSKQKVSMKSGSYKVAATACGYNYAGSESLSGNYEVVYYISTVRY